MTKIRKVQNEIPVEYVKILISKYYYTSVPFTTELDLDITRDTVVVNK